jgi:dephospho-CoA kinase
MSLTIGLTGRSGSGKTYAQHIIQETFNVTIIDLDIIGHSLLETATIKTKIITAFGSSVIDNTRNISRPALGKKVFSNPQDLNKLNSIIHPAIKETVITLIAASSKHVFLVGALLKEIHLVDLCDSIISIISDETKQDKNSKQYKIAQLQRSIDDYKKEADHHLYNTYSDSFRIDLLNLIRSILH